MKNFVTIICILLFSTSCFAQYKTYVLWGGTIIDVTHRFPIEDGAVVVQGRKLGDSGYKNSVIIPPQAETIDVKGKYIMPGIIDVHTHYEKREDLARMFAWGITSTNTMFESTDEALRIQAMANSDTAPLTQVYGAAPIFSTQHGWWWGDEFPIDSSINRFPATPEEARQQVQKVKQKGIGRIKIMYDNMRWCRDPLEPLKQMDVAIMKALTAEAHALGIYVEVHAPQLADAEQAVASGANALMHGVIDGRISGDMLVTMQTNQVMYSSTFSLFNFLADVQGFMKNVLADSIFRSSLPATVISEYSSDAYYQKYRERYPNFTFVQKNLDVLDDNINNLIKNMVSTPLGTDMWALPGIAAHLEMEYQQKAGVKPFEIIINATACSAEFLGIRKTTGYILPGYQADLIILDKNPMDDIRNTRTVSMVIKRGKIFKVSDLLKSLQ